MTKALQTAILAAAVLSVASQSKAQALPILECVEQGENGDTYIAHFGYFNVTSATLDFTAGTSLNQFIPLPANRFQPSSFAPGVHRNVFAVIAPVGTDLTWLVNNQAAVARYDPQLFCGNATVTVKPVALLLPPAGVWVGVPLAIVSSLQVPAGNLAVESLGTINSDGSLSAASAGNLANRAGIVTGDVSASTPATKTYSIELRVSDATGNSALGTVPVTPVDCTAIPDLSSRGSLTQGPLRPNVGTQTWAQTITLTNTSGATLAGPVSVMLDGLPPTAFPANADGATACNATAVRGFLRMLQTGSSLAPGQSITATLQFLNADTRTAITWTPRLIGF